MEELSTITPVTDSRSQPRPSWWKLVLAGLLAFVFGIAAVLLPAPIMFSRILDVVFGEAKPLSGSFTAVAALLALVALVATDGLLNLFGTGLMQKQSASRTRGVVGIAVAVAAIFWPGITAFVAVELIGMWAVLIGILELVFGTRHGHADDRVATAICGVASIAIGLCMMRWVFGGAVFASAVVGVAAGARGIGLLLRGIHERAAQSIVSVARGGRTVGT